MGGHNVRIWRVRRVRQFKRGEREQEEKAGNTEGKKRRRERIRPFIQSSGDGRRLNSG